MSPFEASPPDYSVLAEFYDATPIYSARNDVEFYLNAARQADGPILELGCGTGRVLVPTASAGKQIVGLDSSEPMLARCRQKPAQQPADVQDRALLVHGDMRRFSLGKDFGLLTIPFRGFQHLLPVEEQLTCLGCVYRHLAPGGRLILDVFHTYLWRLLDPKFEEEIEEVPETPLPDGRRFRRTSRVATVHLAEQYNEIELIHYVTYPDGRSERLAQSFPFRYFFRYEVEHLLGRAGFKLVELFGSFDRAALRDDSPDMIFVAEKP